MAESGWVLPLATAAAAALGGGLLAWRLRRRGAGGAGGEGEARELAAERDALLGRLRELAAAGEGGGLQGELEGRLAVVLRRLDEVGAVAAAPAPARPPGLRGFLWGVGLSAAAVLLAALALRTATPRPASPALAGSPPPAGAADAQLEALRARAAAAPGDLEARVDLAAALMARRDLMGVFQETQTVLERDPGHSRALAYQALVRLAMGEPEVALGMLDRALAARPDLPEGWAHLAVVNLQLGRLAEAELAISELERLAPEEAALAARLRGAVAGEGRGAAAPPAAATDAAPEPPRAAGGGGISGVLELDPAFQGRLPRPAVVFVVARPEGIAGGPPVAVARVVAHSFPVPFSLGGDSMMGEPLPGRVRVEARVDFDGEASTREPGEPAAAADGVAAGSSGLRLLLGPAP